MRAQRILDIAPPKKGRGVKVAAWGQGDRSKMKRAHQRRRDQRQGSSGGGLARHLPIEIRSESCSSFGPFAFGPLQALASLHMQIEYTFTSIVQRRRVWVVL